MTSILSHDVVTVASADDIFLQTHSTNPFLTTETLDAAITAFLVRAWVRAVRRAR